jgi:DNA-binding IclR family transcriptional regulator
MTENARLVAAMRADSPGIRTTVEVGMNEEVVSERNPAPAVSRAIAILDLLAAQRGTPLSLSEIARVLGIAKSSTSNLCIALEAGGLINRGDVGYTLGRRTVELGGSYLASFDQVREFYRICARSATLGKQLLQIAMLDGTDVLYLARHEGHAPMRISAGVGDRFPAAVTAVGNALLALLDPSEVARRYENISEWPRLTERSVSSLAELQAKLDKVRERGYALDEGEVFFSVVGLATAISPMASGGAPLAIGASLFKPHDSPTERAEVVDELKRASVQLSNPMVHIEMSVAPQLV